MKDKDTRYHQIIELRFYLVIAFTFIIVTMGTVISYTAISMGSDAVKNKVISLSGNITEQIGMNLDHYLAIMEKNATMVFADEENYTYDPISEESKNMDDYEKMLLTDRISDHLYDICLMENYLDFGIVYSDNSSVGKICKGTKALFGEDLYNGLQSFIINEKTQDGWGTGYHGDYKRIYYIKRLGEHAILATSLYSAELKDIFVSPEKSEAMQIYMIDRKNMVIYSNNSEKCGKLLDMEIEEHLDAMSGDSRLDEDYLLTKAVTSNDWRILSVIPSKDMLEELDTMKVRIGGFAAIAVFMGCLMTGMLTAAISGRLKETVNLLSEKSQTDLLTGLLNKESFNEIVRNQLESSNYSGGYALIFIDIDNFKFVNDNKGHAYGDQVLADFGSVLNRVFRKNDVKGRIGGDEFCVLMMVDMDRSENLRSLVNSRCSSIIHYFEDQYGDLSPNERITASMGACISYDKNPVFDIMYRKADLALYQSKAKGKNRFTVYKEEIPS